MACQILIFLQCVGSSSSDQGSNQGSLHWSFNHWITGEVSNLFVLKCCSIVFPWVHLTGVLTKHIVLYYLMAIKCLKEILQKLKFWEVEQVRNITELMKS